jgi:peptidoglycan/LPS O-acetylase OafA/YrhL
MARNRFYCLEACRGIASLIVVFRHMCVHAFEGPHRIILIPVPSATAVIFFFVLSGTVMGFTHRDDRPGWASSLVFLLHRTLRIYPLYWIILAVTLLTWHFLLNHNHLLSQEYYGLFFPSTLTDIMIAAVGMAGIILSLMVLEKSGQLYVAEWYLVLGKISYPMYVSHWLLMELTFHEFWRHHVDVTKHYMLYAVALTFTSLIGGIMVTYLVDRPIQSVSRRIISAFP